MATITQKFQITMKKFKGGNTFNISPWDEPGPNSSYQKYQNFVWISQPEQKL
jgi:hypothetical protein